MTTDFRGYVSQHPNWQKENYIFTKDSDVYRRLLYKETGKGNYYFTINVKTGEIYNNDNRRIIFLKNFLLVLGRPIHSLAKTLYHISIIAPLAYEITKYINNKQSATDLRRNMYRSCIDIVRTPIYGIVMTIMHIAAMIFGVLSPNTLYKTREIIGQLERDLEWGAKPAHDLWLCIPTGGYLSPCFSPIQNICRGDSIKNTFSKYIRNKKGSHIEPNDFKKVLNKLCPNATSNNMSISVNRT